MTNHRRPSATGAIVFMTLCLQHRGGDLLVRQVAELRRAVRDTRADLPFDILAFVVLPDHLHCVWQLPPGDRALGRRCGAIKSRFSRACLRAAGWPRAGLAPLPGTERPRRKGDAGIWQQRFREHPIRDQADLAAHLTYCWNDPVRHGLCDAPEDWPYSSVHRDRRLGLFPSDGPGAAALLQAGDAPAAAPLPVAPQLTKTAGICPPV